MPSLGHQSKISIDGVAMTCVSETLALRREKVEPEGFAGTRGKASENVREGTRIMTGQTVIECSPLWLITLLEHAMGSKAGLAGAVTASLAETLPTCVILKDTGEKVMTYATCAVNKLELRASRGQFMRATVDWVGLDESVGASGSFGAYTPDDQQALMLHDLAATLLGVGSRKVDDVVITIENNLLLDRYFNAQTLPDLAAGMRVITLALNTPWDSTHSDLYNVITGGIAAVLAFTNGATAATFTFAKWQIPPETPTIPGRNGEILLKLAGPVRKSSSTAELSVLLDEVE